jgi:hypothetical protein
MYAGKIASPLPGHKTQVFVASHGIAYAFITDNQRAEPAIYRTSEEESAMERYGTIAMNYVDLSAYGTSVEGPGSRSSDVERDNHVFADLARRTSVIEAWKKLSACRFGRARCPFVSVSCRARKHQWHADDCQRTETCAQML